MDTYDLYCERVGPGLLAEPVNAGTNAAFLLVAWWLWRYARSRGVTTTGVRVLLGLIVCIGIGSALFHTFATLWARVLDELPILVFQLVFLWSYVRRIVGWPRWAAATCVATYLGAAVIARQFPHLLNGSLIYVPAIFMTLALGAYHWWHQFAGRVHLLIATPLLLLAIGLRTADAAVCTQFPLGTHFAWHLLVAIVIWLCMTALLAAGAVRAGACARLRME